MAGGLNNELLPQVRQHLQDARAEVGAEHEQRPVREVRDPHQAENQRKAGRQEEQQSSQGQAIQGLDGPILQGYDSRFLAGGKSLE